MHLSHLFSFLPIHNTTSVFSSSFPKGRMRLKAPLLDGIKFVFSGFEQNKKYDVNNVEDNGVCLSQLCIHPSSVGVLTYVPGKMTVEERYAVT